MGNEELGGNVMCVSIPLDDDKALAHSREVFWFPFVCTHEKCFGFLCI